MRHLDRCEPWNWLVLRVGNCDDETKAQLCGAKQDTNTFQTLPQQHTCRRHPAIPFTTFPNSPIHRQFRHWDVLAAPLAWFTGILKNEITDIPINWPLIPTLFDPLPSCSLLLSFVVFWPLLLSTCLYQRNLLPGRHRLLLSMTLHTMWPRLPERGLQEVNRLLLDLWVTLTRPTATQYLTYAIFYRALPFLQTLPSHIRKSLVSPIPCEFPRQNCATLLISDGVPPSSDDGFYEIARYRFNSNGMLTLLCS